MLFLQNILNFLSQIEIIYVYNSEGRTGNRIFKEVGILRCM